MIAYLKSKPFFLVALLSCSVAAPARSEADDRPRECPTLGEPSPCLVCSLTEYAGEAGRDDELGIGWYVIGKGAKPLVLEKKGIVGSIEVESGAAGNSQFPNDVVLRISAQSETIYAESRFYVDGTHRQAPTVSLAIGKGPKKILYRMYCGLGTHDS